MVEKTQKKSGITEAAADVLAASLRNAGSETFGLGKGQNPAGIAHSAIDLGPTHYFANEPFVNYTNGVPTATPPGQTPPVGSEPMKTLDKDRGEEHATIQKTAGFGGKVNPDNVQNGEGRVRPNLDSISKRQTNVTAYVAPGQGNKDMPWAKESVEVLASQVIDEMEKLDEVAFRYRKLKKAEIAKRRANTEKAKPVYKYDDKKVKKIKEAVAAKFDLSEEDIIDFLNELYEETQSFQDQVAEILASTNEELAEDVAAVFNGENLSEEFKTKATTIFEAAVTSRVTEIANQLEQLALEQLNETVDTIKEELTTQVDDYLNYMVEEWVKDNEIAIEKGLRSEIVEDFISGLRTLFVEHYIDIPEDKVDLVSELSDKVDELQESLNSEIARGVELHKLLGEAKKSEILDAVCEGLVQTQVEKVKTLAESVAFTTENEYAEKLTTIRENYFPTQKAKTPGSKDILNENQMEVGDEQTDKVVDPIMQSIMGAISRTVK
jgi:hypothetical protein